MSIPRRLLSLTVALFCLGSVAGQEQRPVRCYVQLVWGTNREKPKEAQYRPIGPKLKSELSRVFQWQQYWEVNRRWVDVAPGKQASVRLSPDCEVHIELCANGLRETRIYGKKVLVTRSRQRQDCHKMVIHGAALETGGSWFVVVRDDPPSESREPGA